MSKWHTIRRAQTHRAYVEQVDFYSLSEEQYQEYNTLPEEDREFFLMEVGDWQIDKDSMDIIDLLETVEVKLEETDSYD